MGVLDFITQWHNANDSIVLHIVDPPHNLDQNLLLSKKSLRENAERAISFFAINRNSVVFVPMILNDYESALVAVMAVLSQCYVMVCNPVEEAAKAESVDLMHVQRAEALVLIAHPEWSARIKNILVGSMDADREIQASLVQAGYNSYEITAESRKNALKGVFGIEFSRLAWAG